MVRSCPRQSRVMEEQNAAIENAKENVQNQISSKNEPMEDSERFELCGWRSWMPDNFQRFASSKWLLCVICIFVFIQNAVTNGFVNASITTLERRFDLSSSQVALISGSYDIAAAIGVVPVSYYFANRHKGRALTTGLILYGFGALLFSSPHFFAPVYSFNARVEHNSSQTFCSLSDGSDNSCDIKDNEGQDLSNYLYIFIAAQLMMGLASTPLYTIGVSYFDENVKHNVVGVYIGILIMVSVLAVTFGYVVGGMILNNIYVNLFSKESPSAVPLGEWIGAWWLGFLIGAFVSFLAAIPMSCFPAHLPGYYEITKEKVAASIMKRDKDDHGMLLSRTPTDFGKWKDLPSATWDLLTNATYLFVSLGLCWQIIITGGYVVFLPKFLEVLFLTSPGTSAYLTGLFATISGALATILAGWAIRKRKMNIAEMLKMILIATAVGASVRFSLFFKCPEPPLVGVSEPYDSSFSNVDLKAQCNTGCPCNDTTYDAVCGSDDRVYFNACYAGCSVYNEQSKTFHNCSCFPSKVDVDLDLLDSASKGKCANKTCANLYIFLVLLCISSACGLIKGPPCDIITLRCVPHSQRSLALAVQWVMVRCLGTIPGPFLVGSLFDASCLLWNRTYDGSRGRCYRYDRKQLSILSVGIVIGIDIASFVFYSLTYFSHRKQIKKPENLFEMSVTENTVL